VACAVARPSPASRLVIAIGLELDRALVRIDAKVAKEVESRNQWRELQSIVAQAVDIATATDLGDQGGETVDKTFLDVVHGPETGKPATMFRARVVRRRHAFLIGPPLAAHVDCSQLSAKPGKFGGDDERRSRWPKV
jgi:hypothetical protein